MKTTGLPLICLAASGGGHIRQILDLKPFWQDYPHFIVTEDTSLGRSIAQSEDVHFVPHFALGQARLGHRWTMLREALRSIPRSFRLMRARRPALFVTTGAGSQLFPMLFARLFGARVVLIDSFARFHAPSAFARLAGRFAHDRIAQSAASGRAWGVPTVFDPFRTIDAPRPAKEPLLLATVGATLPFDRLVRLVGQAKAAGLVPERVVIQRGIGGHVPAGVESVEEMSFDDMRGLLSRADIVVCHGGTGSLITALREQCRVIAVPRLFERGEHYDDHQAEIVGAFVERGLIDTAETDAEFAAALQRARSRTPIAATTDPSALIAHLRRIAENLPPQ